jgi:chromosome segregation ATPase
MDRFEALQRELEEERTCCEVLRTEAEGLRKTAAEQSVQSLELIQTLKAKKKEQKQLLAAHKKESEEWNQSKADTTASIAALEARAQGLEKDIMSLIEHNFALQAREKSLETEARKAQRQVFRLTSEIVIEREKRQLAETSSEDLSKRIAKEMAQLEAETAALSSSEARSQAIKARLRTIEEVQLLLQMYRGSVPSS